MNYEASATTANNGTVVSPAIDLGLGADDAELSFWMHAFGADMGTLECWCRFYLWSIHY